MLICDGVKGFFIRRGAYWRLVFLCLIEDGIFDSVFG